MRSGTLSPSGKVRMPLDRYPFSERFGWLQDRYGLSWQVILAAGTEMKQRFIPALMFVGKNVAKPAAPLLLVPLASWLVIAIARGTNRA